MKVAFVVLSILAMLAVCVDPDVEYLKKFVKAFLVCKKKPDFKNVDEQSVPKDVAQIRTFQCFIACKGKEMGIVTDNKLNMTQIKTLFANYRKMDPKKYEGIIRHHETCTKETDKDECVAGYKIMHCITQEYQKANKA